MQSKPTTVLLAIIAALLAANLLVSTDREAEARAVGDFEVTVDDGEILGVGDDRGRCVHHRPARTQ